MGTNKMDAFKGKYNRTSAENYEELLKVLDVSFLLRKAATVSTPVLEITEEGGVWNIKTSTTSKPWSSSLSLENLLMRQPLMAEMLLLLSPSKMEKLSLCKRPRKKVRRAQSL